MTAVIVILVLIAHMFLARYLTYLLHKADKTTFKEYPDMFFLLWIVPCGSIILIMLLIATYVPKLKIGKWFMGDHWE